MTGYSRFLPDSDSDDDESLKISEVTLDVHRYSVLCSVLKADLDLTSSARALKGAVGKALQAYDCGWERYNALKLAHLANEIPKYPTLLRWTAPSEYLQRSRQHEGKALEYNRERFGSSQAQIRLCKTLGRASARGTRSSRQFAPLRAMSQRDGALPGWCVLSYRATLLRAPPLGS